jgi:hypothetical protein
MVEAARWGELARRLAHARADGRRAEVELVRARDSGSRGTLPRPPGVGPPLGRSTPSLVLSFFLQRPGRAGGGAARGVALAFSVTVDGHRLGHHTCRAPVGTGGKRSPT